MPIGKSIARHPELYPQGWTSEYNRAFWFARRCAERRAHQWHLTPSQFYQIWDTSGHWHQRGQKRGQYVMARHHDAGHYQIGNVSIVRAETNSSANGRSRLGRAQPARRSDTPGPGTRRYNRNWQTANRLRLNARIRARARCYFKPRQPKAQNQRKGPPGLNRWTLF